MVFATIFSERACLASNLFSSLTAIARRALSIIASDKDCCNGEEVFLELGNVTFTVCCCGRLLAMVENHEADAALPQHVLDKVKGDSAEPIAVSDNNLLEFSSHCPVQNGDKAAALEVDARRNIRNDLMLGIEMCEGVALTDEVGLLFLARDAGVDDFRAHFRGRGSCFDSDAKRRPDVWHAIESLASITDADVADGTFLSESAERVVANAVGGSDVGCREIWSAFLFIFVHMSLVFLSSKHRMNKSGVIDAIYVKRHSIESYFSNERYLSDISYRKICSDLL